MTNREIALSAYKQMTDGKDVFDLRKVPQEANILAHMLVRGPITPLEALNYYGCMRLGARIYDLEHKYPIRIKHEMIGNGKKTYMQYSLEEDDDAES